MYSIKQKAITCLLLLLSTLSFAQKKDSVQKRAVAFVADKFPFTRVLNVEYTNLTPYKFSQKLEDSNFNLPESKVKNFQQIKANANLYFFKKEKWTISTALNYKYTTANIDNLSSTMNETKQNFHYHSEAVTASHISKLWKKTAIYSATASVDGNENSFERFRGLLTGSIMITANERTKLLLGLAVIIDPSSQVPTFPIISYEHKFKNGWIADIILPKRVMMKKNVFNNGRFSLGSEMDVTSFYFDQSNKTFEFRQTEINSGVMYEHRIGDFIGTVKTGLRSIPTGRIFEKNESFNDYIYEYKPKSSFYFNFGISYNPFGNKKR
ncbi:MULTISPECIES: DUF6268 family outer membrane beta-barrel protein [Empedobacter]|uniref:Outer membrane protein beta-barrel domain-containing protein n=1 Tax=Empedobacter falsenii TaxID=343874 RepID=A0A376GJ31_9FLAO|nr:MULTISPECIES: hypothetical protein [Empedobacter]STD59362.1 Uncharacterised protein [Empedobacter falsenii]